MEVEKYLELIIKERQNKLGSEEKSLLQDWLRDNSENQNLQDDLQKVWNVTKHYQESYVPDVKTGFARFQEQMGNNYQATADTALEDYTELIIKNQQGKLSSAEEASLNTWAQQETEHSELQEDVKKLWQVTEQYQESYTPDVAAGFARFQQTLNNAGETKDENILLEDELYTELITKKLSGNISSEENATLDNWLAADEKHHKLYEELANVWSGTEHYQESYEPDVTRGFEKFTQLIAAEDTPQNNTETPVRELPAKPRRRFGMFGIAAAIALLLVAGYWVMFGQSSQVEIATTENTKTVVLPDGSTVSLNKNSTLSYNKKFEIREVKLKGEAFFEVTKQNGKSFAILSNGTKTEVLGTSFNIKAVDNTNNVEVTVVTGKVAVSLAKTPQKKILLTPGDKAVYRKKTALIKKEKSNDKNFLAWKTHRLAFDNHILKDIIPELERFYKIKFEVSNPKMLNCRFTGTFDNINLEQALKIIKFTLDASYKKSGNKYIIEGKGCN